jgi:hypothetical protein
MSSVFPAYRQAGSQISKEKENTAIISDAHITKLPQT